MHSRSAVKSIWGLILVNELPCDCIGGSWLVDAVQ
jgi:hypothetical protein